MKQATEYINTVGASMQKTSVSMQQAGEIFQSAGTEPKTHARIGSRQKRSGYDGDMEGVPDKCMGAKSTKILEIHVRIPFVIFSIQLPHDYLRHYFAGI